MRCDNLFCVGNDFGCSQPSCPFAAADHGQLITNWPPTPVPPSLFNPPMPYRGFAEAVPMGCICPPGSEKTCEGEFCPRRKPL